MTRLPKIVFFGSGPVACSTLQGILPYFDIEAIVTKPRADGFRGSVPVLEFAQKNNVPFYTPRTKNELTDLFASKKFSSQVGLVVDYGIIISLAVINSFPKGIVNSHFSLLPEWRGADPITFSVLSGQEETGVSLMLINEKLDEGELILQSPHKLTRDITTPELTNQLTTLSNRLLVENLPKYICGELKIYPQPNTPISYSRKLNKDDGALDINKSAIQLEREVRAFAGWPKSKINLFGHNVIVKKARVAESKTDGALVISCANNSYLEIIQLTAPSGRTMSGADFLRGYKKG